MKLYDDNARRLTEKQIEVYEKLLSYVPAIKEVIRKFDGKALTKRLDTALKEVYKGASCRKDTFAGDWQLTLSEWEDRSITVKSENPFNGAEDCICMYVQYNMIYFASSTSKWCFDGKLIADNMIEEIDSVAKSYEETVARLKGQLARIDEIIAEYNRISEAQYNFSHDVDYVIRGYFGLKL